MIDFLFAIIALSVLIIVHEFGHFLMAKCFDVKVLEFSLGFGKKLLHYKKGETTYAISAVPLGGFVKLLGESPDDEVAEEDRHRTFSDKSPFRRFLIVFAGPVFNILFAVFIFYFFFISGHIIAPRVGHVAPEYPAYEAGIREGDIILQVEGKRIIEWNDLLWEMAYAKSGPMRFVFERDGKKFAVMITPKEVQEKNALGSVVKMKKVGIAPSEALKEGYLSAIPKSFQKTYNIIEKTLVGIYRMIIGRIPAKEIGGPIAILQLGTKQAEGGLWSLTAFAAFISISLGVFNLLPIPVLDGGHILFTFIEIITRRRVSERTIEIAQKIGLTLLIMLMIFAFYNDVERLLHMKGFLDKIIDFFAFFTGKS